MLDRIVNRTVGAVVVGLFVVAGCSVESPEEETVAIDDAAVAEGLKAIGPGSGGTRCSIKGDPPVTTGCEAGDTCLPYACTNSIPPSCVGFCQAPLPPKDDRCDVTGDPPVTTGCDAGETCAVEACTNSIPPHCWGHCQ